MQIAGGEGQMRSAVQDVALHRREIAAIAVGIDKAVALLGGHVAHVANGAVDGVSAIKFQVNMYPPLSFVIVVK